MDVLEIINEYWKDCLLYLLIGSGIIEITPIKLNPISAVLSWIGKGLNKQMQEDIKGIDKKVDNVQKALDEHILANAYDEAKNIRQRVLRFNDEILQGSKHTQEHFIEILSAIDDYEDFCGKHPEFPNNQAILAIANIKEVYQKCLNEKSFL